MWLARFGTLYNREVTATLANIWGDHFKGYKESQLSAAFKEVEKEFGPTAACPFPTPAHLHKFLNQSRGNAEEIEAHQAWTRAITVIDAYNPDLPQYRMKFESYQVEQALEAAGGVNFLSNCTEEQLMWAQKEFVKSLLAWNQLDADSKKQLLEHADLKKLTLSAIVKEQLKA